jgi:hypothetical protein
MDRSASHDRAVAIEGLDGAGREEAHGLAEIRQRWPIRRCSQPRAIT